MASYPLNLVTDRLYFREPPFDLLMQKRIVEILMLCSDYDRFVLEEDGRFEERLCQEYAALGLRYPPRFTFTNSAEQTVQMLDARSFDLAITMLVHDGASDLASLVKEHSPETPLVALTRSTCARRDTSSSIHNVFHWQGDVSILLAVIKLLEDAMNIEQDAMVVGVPCIILVEDSIRYYSSYLPLLYRVLLEQARDLTQDRLNEQQRMLSMRGRPKILLATDYEQALELYHRYRGNLLGIISDVSFEKEGEVNRRAGFLLCQRVRRRDPCLPFLLQSSREDHAREAAEHQVEFFFKHSKTLLEDLRSYFRRAYGFGDFVFRMPDTGAEIDRAESLGDLQRKLQSVPAGSIEYHARHSHFSMWLKARALYSLANILVSQTVESFDDIESVREYLIDTIRNFRLHAGRGVIARFDRRSFDESSVLQRIGDGSIGGKARGIAFVNSFLKHHRIMFKHNGVAIQIPKTVVLTTEIFEQFMADNELTDFALEEHADEEILERFLQAELPPAIHPDLAALATVMQKPLAVRSSSVLEDSYTLPLAGVYSTYFTPNNSDNVEARALDLARAIKGVFASTYFSHAKQYAESTQTPIEEERMAVVIQEATGTRYGDYFYPNISGVARSLNVYPIEHEKPEQGVASIALGLGKTVVEGRASLRFSPAHPRKILQLSDPQLALKSTQRSFFGLDLRPNSFAVTTDAAYNLRLLPIVDAVCFPANARLMSTFDISSQSIRHDPHREGRKVLTFASVLRYDTFPLAPIIAELLQLGATRMNMPVEIEFACNLDVPADGLTTFKFLQIRPIVDSQEFEEVTIGEISREQSIITTSSALGHGLYSDLHDLVYVRPQDFDPARTVEIAGIIERINQQLKEAGRRFILAGPGRWGSADPWLGVPVKWCHITQARVIVEVDVAQLFVDPSQGTHFFQNLTAHGVAYLTTNGGRTADQCNVAYLDAQPAVYDDGLVRHLRFDDALTVKVDGRQREGRIKAVVFKPGSTTKQHSSPK